MSSYFTHFPKTKGNDQTMVDLFTNVSFVDKTLLDEIKTEPFEVLPDDNMEDIANFLYKDPYYFYVVLMVNNIQNPYDSWILDNNEFNRVLIDQYQQDYLTKHTSRVVKLINKYFDQFYTFEFTKKVPQGKYYLRITHSDPKSHGLIQLNVDIRSSIEEYTVANQIYSNVTFNYIENTINSKISLIDSPYAVTKIYIPETSNVQIKLSADTFLPFLSKELKSTTEVIDQFPYHVDFYVDQNQEFLVEIDQMFPAQCLYFSGLGTGVTIELYTINGLLIYKTSSGQTENIINVLNGFKDFQLTKTYSYESDSLYAYSSELITAIIDSIYQQQTATHFLNFSLDEFKNNVIQQYLKQFSPVMYDILIDYTNSMINNENLLSEFNKQKSLRVKCASNFNINIHKPPTMVDNIPVTKNSLVLIKNQDNAEENGIYKVNEKGFFVKDSVKIYPHMSIFVELGLKNQQTEWFLNNKTKNVITKHEELHFVQNLGIINPTEKTSSYFIKHINSLFESSDYHYYAYDIYNETHHWETTDRNMLGAGVVVDENTEHSSRVTNFDVENLKNDSKKNIRVLKPTYLDNYIEQFYSLLKAQQ